MSLLFETIKVKGNVLLDIDYHNARMNKSRKELFGAIDSWNLETMIDLPELNPDQVYRCKCIYDMEFQSVDIVPYLVKPLKTLKLIPVDANFYQYKYLNRTVFNCSKRKNFDVDDIIFVVNNKISDCSYANLVFFDGINWITPSTPLLKGTKRQRYLDEQIISEHIIEPKDLKGFTKMKIINAMIDLDESPEISMANILV